MPYIDIWQENVPKKLEVFREVTVLRNIQRRKGGWVISYVHGNKVSLCLQIETYANNRVN
jgi:hypothetical protein